MRGISRSRYLLCVDNGGFPVSLEVKKIYRSLADPKADDRGLARVIDESGEDYLYPADCFIPIELPRATSELFGLAS